MEHFAKGNRSRSETGYLGVRISTSGRRFRATVNYLGKPQNVGTFDTPEQAAMQYDKKLLELSGWNIDKNRLNFSDRWDLKKKMLISGHEHFHKRRKLDVWGPCNKFCSPHTISPSFFFCFFYFSFAYFLGGLRFIVSEYTGSFYQYFSTVYLRMRCLPRDCKKLFFLSISLTQCFFFSCSLPTKKGLITASMRGMRGTTNGITSKHSNTLFFFFVRVV